MDPLEGQQVLLTTVKSSKVLKSKIHKHANNFVHFMTDGSKWSDLEPKCLLVIAV